MGLSQSTTAMVFDPRWYQGVKAVKVQRQASTQQKEFVKFLQSIKRESGFKLIYEVDDVVFKELIPDYNKFKFAFDTEEIRQNCVDIINMCDEVTVTCDYMKKIYQENTGKKEITVVPNFVPKFWMGNHYNKRKIQQAYDDNKHRPRILYAGSGAHYDIDNKVGGKDDFAEVLDVVIKTRKKYKWIFLGAFPPPIAEYIRSREIEFYNWTSLMAYPDAITKINPQLIVAPLIDNEFNRAKSNIKFLESCVMGLPCLVQNMVTYQDAPDFLKFKDAQEFEDKIGKVLGNRKNYHGNVETFRSVGEQYFLERPENIGCHIEALTTPWNSPERNFLKKWNK